MTTRPLDRDDPLDDFDRRTIRLLGTDRLVYVTGGGPAVIVMTEMPGISPHVARFARWVRDAGFTVYMPHIFGKDGAVPRMPGTLFTMIGGCISRQFRAFQANESSPATQWLRALAALAHEECGGKGVGA
ncbi:MAG TPA: dienelactone hydrolase family protein, partial [Sphingopyxis terrae]|nr:dienelactone hydrolase family protein [Sphingopyxis terrae]